jgi:hypothetical protein
VKNTKILLLILFCSFIWNDTLAEKLTVEEHKINHLKWDCLKGIDKIGIDHAQ